MRAPHALRRARPYLTCRGPAASLCPFLSAAPAAISSAHTHPLPLHRCAASWSAMATEASPRSAAAADTLAKLAAGGVPWGAATTDKMLIARWTKAGGWAPAEVRPVADGIGLSPVASGLHYGAAVFEGMKIFAAADADAVEEQPLAAAAGARAALLRPGYHAARLNAGAARMALPAVDAEALVRGVASLARAARDAGWLPAARGASLYVRPLLVASEPVLGVRRSKEAVLAVTLHPVGSYFSSTGAPASLRLRVDPAGRMRAWPGGVGACKTGGGYAASLVPAEEAAAEGYDQVLWTGAAPAREVGEVGQMNVCWVEVDADGRRTLVTPALDGSILAGATRDSVLAVAVEAGLVDAVEERRVPLAELTGGIARGEVVEMFGTGTGAIIVPVKSVSVTENGGEVVEYVVKAREEPGDASATLREFLLDVFHQVRPSKWMVDIDVVA